MAITIAHGSERSVRVFSTRHVGLDSGSVSTCGGSVPIRGIMPPPGVRVRVGVQSPSLLTCVTVAPKNRGRR